MATTQLFTAEDLIRMPPKDRFELWKGELRPMPPPNCRHAEVIGNIVLRLAMFVKANKLGHVFAGDAGFLLARNPDIVLGADVSFVRPSTLPGGVVPNDRYPQCAPDLAIEVVSPSQSAREVEDKAQEWLSYGSAMAVVVDERTRTVKVFRSKQATQVLQGDDAFDGQDVVPGFRLPLSEIFE
jgi:Uma2 family endonuclease